MVNAQQWLDKEYPVNRRNEISELSLNFGNVKRWNGHRRTLKGDLKLEGFTNLRTLKISVHQLTALDVSDSRYLTDLDCSNNQLNNLIVENCLHLEKIECSRNYLRELNLNDCKKLREINAIANNSLEEIDISENSKLSKIGFGFSRDTKRKKLLRTTQITPVTEKGTRNVLVIGEEHQKDYHDLLQESSELREIIESCNGIIYVDNPPIPEIDEDEDDEEMIEEQKLERGINQEKRDKSRETVLNHLANNCLEIYKLKKWDSIHDQVSKCMDKISEQEKELTNNSDQTEQSQIRRGISKEKEKVVEQVNVTLGTELSLTPKFTAQVEMINVHLSRLWKK